MADGTACWAHSRSGGLGEGYGTIAGWDGGVHGRRGGRSLDSRRENPGYQSGRIEALAAAACVRAPACVCCARFACSATGGAKEGRGRAGSGRTCGARPVDEVRAEEQCGACGGVVAMPSPKARSRPRCSPTLRRPLRPSRCTRRRGCHQTRPGRPTSLLRLRRCNAKCARSPSSG